MRTMSTPTVTEIPWRPDPVEHDTFIDELTELQTAGAPAAVQRVARDGSIPSPR
jgi:hypothetical protein